ncbi:MAG: 4Fe-4S dicluster domain-containing protein, partial [Planctomycetota bacterium]
DEDLERIGRHVTQNMDTLCTGCGYCMGRCPKDIPISGFMQYYNEKLLHGKTDTEMVEQLKFHREWGLIADREANAVDCIQCGRCELACTQHLDIINRLGEIEKWEGELKAS